MPSSASSTPLFTLRHADLAQARTELARSRRMRHWAGTAIKRISVAITDKSQFEAMTFEGIELQLKFITKHWESLLKWQENAVAAARIAEGDAVVREEQRFLTLYQDIMLETSQKMEMRLKEIKTVANHHTTQSQIHREQKSMVKRDVCKPKPMPAYHKYNTKSRLWFDVMCMAQQKEESIAGLRALMDTPRKALDHLQALGEQTEHWDLPVIHILVQKMPLEMAVAWNRDRPANPTLEQLYAWLNQRLRAHLFMQEHLGHRGQDEMTLDESKRQRREWSPSRWLGNEAHCKEKGEGEETVSEVQRGTCLNCDRKRQGTFGTGSEYSASRVSRSPVEIAGQRKRPAKQPFY